MQGGQGPSGEEPGRGVYVVRRILAALVVLLLLALLVPQACQALLGSREELGSAEQDTAEVVSSGGEESTGETEDVAEQRETVDTRSGSSETGVSENVSSTAGDAEDVVQNIELDAEPPSLTEGLEEVAASPVSQVAPIPVVDVAAQQPVTPIALQEPTVPVEPAVPAEQPITPAQPTAPVEPIVPPVEPIVSAETTAFAEPIVPTEPIFFDESLFVQEPVFYEQPLPIEELAFEEPVASYANDAVVSATASTEEGGGSGAYAAITPDRGHR